MKPVSSVHIGRLFRTSAMRMALKYALIYTLALAAAIGALRWTSSHYIDEETSGRLQRTFDDLMQVYRADGLDAVERAVADIAPRAVESGLLYIITHEGEKISGTIHDWPEEDEIALDGQLRNIWIEDDVLPAALFEDDAFLPVIATNLGPESRLLLTIEVEQLVELHELTEYLIEVLSVAVLLALVMSVILGNMILRRMESVRKTASEIMTGDLGRRITVGDRNDEFDALATDLNTMLDRIQQLVKGVREVTDNIAHDMRSPLTRLRNRLEVILLEPRSSEQYVDAIHSATTEADSLIRTFNSLLSISRAEAGNHRSEWRDVDLNRLLADLVELFTPAAEEKQQALELHGSRDAVVAGSRDLLAQAFGNLIENALKYSPSSSTIQCVIMPTKDHVKVMIRDSGPGIPEKDHDRVLQRFVRLDDSRQTPGNGLGLSLVNAVSTLYRAEFGMENTPDGFQVYLDIPRVKSG